MKGPGGFAAAAIPAEPPALAEPSGCCPFPSNLYCRHQKRCVHAEGQRRGRNSSVFPPAGHRFERKAVPWRGERTETRGGGCFGLVKKVLCGKNKDFGPASPRAINIGPSRGFRRCREVQALAEPPASPWCRLLRINGMK